MAAVCEPMFYNKKPPYGTRGSWLSLNSFLYKSTVESGVMKIFIFIFYLSTAYATRDYSANRDDLDEEERGRIYMGPEYNISQIPTTTGRTMKGEIIVEKFVDTLMASERYLKMVETVEKKLDHLEVIFQERSNSILKYLAEVLRVVKSPPTEVLDTALRALKTDLDKLKLALSNRNDEVPHMRVDGSECQMDPNLDSRLSFLENHIKSIMNSVDSISGIISEVKTRQFSRTSTSTTGGALEALTLISEFRRAIHEQKSRKCDCKSGRVDRSERYPTDCREIQQQGFNVSGIYKIKPDDIEAFYVLCDLTSSGGGWTVIQNRFDGSQDFYKSWSEYKHGFGNLAGEFWLGLEKLFYLTNQKLYELRVEMEAAHGQEASAGYSVFTIGPEYEGYRISTLGTYRGNAGDSLSYHAGQKFSAYDADNDEWKDGACAVEHGGAWWYKECDKSNLNGKYSANPDEHSGQSIYWITFKGPNSPLFKSRIMIRPLPATRPLDQNEQPRNILDGPKQDKQKARAKDVKGTYEMGRGRSPYRYDDNAHADGFFPNYA